MLTIIIQIIVGILGGIASSLQASFNGITGIRLGTLESVAITYVGGGIIIILIGLGMGGGNFNGWRNLPWYVFLAGPMGLIIIGSLSYTVPRLGAAPAITVFITTWLIFSAINDHFGWFGLPQRTLDLPRLLGIVTLLAGTWLMVRE